MESADLRIFRAVAREGSITKAAGRLGYVQSNVTARVQHLESELGIPLLIRNNRGVTLSPGGKTLLDYAERILGLMDEAAKAVSYSGEPSGPLRIGSSQTAAAVRMPALLADYHRRYPKVQLSLVTGHRQALIEQVLQYELDGAFITGTCTHPEIQAAPAFDEQPVIVAAASVSRLEEAIAKPLLVYSQGCSYRETLEDWLRSAHGMQPAVMEFGILEAIVGGIAAGLGISLLPLSAVSKHVSEGTLRAFDLPEPYNRLQTQFITRKEGFVSASLSALIGTLEDYRGDRL